MIWCDVKNENCATAPALALFVWGFLYTSGMLIAQAWIKRARFGLQQASPLDVRPAASGAAGF